MATITDMMSCNGKVLLRDDWEIIAREGLESLDEKRDEVQVKIEVRYFYQNVFGFMTKYRLVCHEGDHLEIPPPRVVHKDDRPINPPVLQCLLFSSHPGIKPLDVTHRVMKYMGPNKDFGSTPFRVFEMFPFDDPDEIQKEYSVLVVFDLWNKTAFKMDDTLFDNK